MLDNLKDKVGGFYSISNSQGFILKAFVLSHTDIDIAPYYSSKYNIDNGNIMYFGEYYCDSLILIDENDNYFYLIEEDYYGKEYSNYIIIEHGALNDKRGRILKLQTISDMVFAVSDCLMIEFY